MKLLKDLYMVRVGYLSSEILATANSDVQSKMRAQELHKPSELMARPQATLPAVSSRNTIPDPSDTYLSPIVQAFGM